MSLLSQEVYRDFLEEAIKEQGIEFAKVRTYEMSYGYVLGLIDKIVDLEVQLEDNLELV